jgi:hypothetical protein
MHHAEAGDTRIEIWIAGITDPQVEALQEKLADLLVAEGYGCRDDALSIVAVFAAAMPDADTFVADMGARGAARFLLPMAG